MSNFDLRKFLAEGKLYKENLADIRMEAEGDARIFHKDLVTKYGFDAVADALEAAYDNAEEGGMGYENIADTLKMDNSILIDMIEDTLAEGVSKPTKMKMSELKKKIREEILSELTLNEDDDIDFGTGGEETEGKDGENVDPVAEATKDGDGEVPSKDADTDIDIEDKEEVEVDVEKKPKVTGADGEFLDQLEDLKDEADAMGDNKLERQIDNTITYFTRQHIAKDTNESIELEEDLTEAITADMIQKKYNEMFGKNPQTTFADVAKALNTTEQEVAAVLFKLPMFEADELEEADDMALVADLETELAEGDSEFQRVDRGDKDVTAKDKAEEEVYGAGVKKGEEIEKKKLQKESVTFPLWKKLNG